MELLDYPTLRVIWWLFIGVLLSGFAIMDGHDMGIGSLLPFVGRNDAERRVVINTVGAHWEGNQTWFVTSGGAIFAALPLVYATAFSGFYWAMLAVLWALFFRPVGFKYRSLIHNDTWRNTWDWLLALGSFVPALVFGVAIGNVLEGVPFYFTQEELRSFYTGSFWALLNPFALLCGVISVAMLIFHGGIYLMHRTDGKIYERTRKTLRYSAAITVIGYALAGIWLFFMNGYVVTSHIDPAGPSDPLLKTVALVKGAWLHNYVQCPLAIIIPILGFAGIIGAYFLAQKGKTLCAFVASAVGLTGIIGSVGASMFPFIMPSSSNPQSSLLVWDATSSHTTLFVMLIATVIFLPTVVFYTAWCFRMLRGKVTENYIRNHEHSSY